MSETRRLALQERPGLDALAAAWLAERFPDAGDPSELVAAMGGPLDEPGAVAHAAAPAAPLNGRKRPKFSDLYAASAAGRVWTKLLKKGAPAAHLVDLVDALRHGPHAAGDAPDAPWAGVWLALRRFWDRAEARAADERALYHSMCDWLDEYQADLGMAHVRPVDWDRVDGVFPKQPGTYALVLETAAPGGVMVGRTGRIGRMEVRPGYYVYIGSACGQGGLRGRMRHHLRPARELRLKWQVDFLRLRCSVAEVWYTVDRLATTPLKRECAVAECVLGMVGAAVPAARFGGSERACRCPAHLAYFGSRPSFWSFRARAKQSAVPCGVHRVLLGQEEI